MVVENKDKSPKKKKRKRHQTRWTRILLYRPCVDYTIKLPKVINPGTKVN